MDEADDGGEGTGVSLLDARLEKRVLTKLGAMMHQ